jgi:glutamine synthetase
MTDKAKTIFEKHGVLNRTELEARYEILQENYATKIQIEASVLKDLAISHILPAVLRYHNELIDNVAGLQSLGLDKKTYKAQMELIEEIAGHLNATKLNCEKMLKEMDKAEKLADAGKFAKACADNVKPYFDVIREHVDSLESLVDDSDWPLPKYREMLFIR